MRAREPDAAGHIERDGVRVGWERWDPLGRGDRVDPRVAGNPTLLFACTTPIVESRMWKAQIPWFSQRFTCITVDPRGNGRSDRVDERAALADHESVRDLLAVLDANDVGEAVLVGLCSSAGIGLLVAASHPERVAGLVAINPGLDVTAPHAHRAGGDEFHGEPHGNDGWALENRHHWERDWERYAGFFFGEMLPEPHSTKQLEDCLEWANATSIDVMLAARSKRPEPHFERSVAEAVCRRVRCSALVICGTDDQCQPPDRGRRVAELTGGELIMIEGAGHLPIGRDPVVVNLEIDRFLSRRCRRR